MTVNSVRIVISRHCPAREPDLEDWAKTFPKSERPLDESRNPFAGWELFEAMPEDGTLRFAWHNLAWMLARFMHGEQGALLVASRVTSRAPTRDAKLYAASQTFD